MTRKHLLLPLFFAVALALALTAGVPVAVQDQTKVDAIFSRWTTSTPGCAVGASVNGTPVLDRAYGMADLEHDVKNVPETLFEAGSVSKQFTAAAVLLLAKDGKLSLDDPIRKYVPEVPDYGTPITIRQLITHTSGLRDWGSVAGIGGWPRTSRVYTHAHVLEIVSRQRSLNFTPGSRWSYSNSGYNLSAIIVSRVSGMSFADFTRTRIFEPLGMTRSSWRDDHTRIVKGRAIAYSAQGSNFRTAMPFENVFGNSSLLTTVGDLLKWNENFTTPKVGDAAFVQEQQTPGRFSDGRPHYYALGLTIDEYKGVREIGHSGSTAGYRAHLVRYPDARVSVAVLCNVSTGAATQYAHAVADLYLGDRLKAATPPKATHQPTAAELDAVAGLYAEAETGQPVSIVHEKGMLRAGQTALVPLSASRFVTDDDITWELDGRGGAKWSDDLGTTTSFRRVDAAKPTAAQLAELAGRYVSDEAEVVLEVAVEGVALVLKRRPDSVIRLTPVYADAFLGPIGLVRFHRQGAAVTSFSINQDRVWDLRFTRQAAAKPVPRLE